MKRYCIIRLFLLVVLVMLGNIRQAENVPVMVSEPLTQAMQATGAALEEMTFSGWSRLPLLSVDDGQLEDIVVEAMQQLGYTADTFTTTIRTNANQQMVQAVVNESGRQITVIAEQVRSGDKHAEGQVYLIINIALQSDDWQLVAVTQQTIAQIIAYFDATAEINTCLVGGLDGKLLKDQWGSRLEDALAAIDAKPYTMIENNHYASLTGFSKRLNHNGVQAAEERINVHAAIRYSSYDNRTYVIIASPVITGEY